MSHRLQPAPELQFAPERELRRAGPGAPGRQGVRPASRSAFRIPPALTLIEMLVALAVTLVMMAAVVNLFANLSGSIRNRRAVIELSGQLRQVRQRMALDLAGATCDARTWIRPGENRGYIEYIEGRRSDIDPSILVDGINDPPDNRELDDYATSLVPRNNLVVDYNDDDEIDDADEVLHQSNRFSFAPGALGDWDDILALTVRSESDPFVARVGGNTVESTLAEVIWFAGENSPDDPTTPEDESGGLEPGMRRIYRRVMLIAPWLGPWTGNPPHTISVHHVPASGTEPERWVANTLGDLSKREYRVGRAGIGFPHPLPNDRLNSDAEYLVLDDVLGFDIRIYDPGAPLFQAMAGSVVQPGDPGWLAAVAPATLPPPAGFGAYCDLGWGWDPKASPPDRLRYPRSALAPVIPRPVFNIPREVGWHPQLITSNLPPYQQALVGYPAVYDTWSFHYENDGINQEPILEQFYNGEDPKPLFDEWRKNIPGQPDEPIIDQGTNGFDDDNIFGVDDVGERETSPPYDAPLRGLQVRFRVYEFDARQIREASVTHSFAP